MVGPVKESTDTRLFRRLSRKFATFGPGLSIPERGTCSRSSPDVDSELEQLAVDAWRSPTRIFSADVADEVTNLAWDGQSPWLALPNHQRPAQAKCIAMPGNDGFGLDDHQ